jgi:hypothetical protein
MHSITAAMIGDRLYEIGRRCSHPFLDSVEGVVVTGIDTASPVGCTAAVEVSFDDGTTITTALSHAILCWQPVAAGDNSSINASLPVAVSPCPDGKAVKFDESVDRSSKPKRVAKRKKSAKPTKTAKHKSVKKTATA